MRYGFGIAPSFSRPAGGGSGGSGGGGGASLDLTASLALGLFDFTKAANMDRGNGPPADGDAIEGVTNTGQRVNDHASPRIGANSHVWRANGGLGYVERRQSPFRGLRWSYDPRPWYTEFMAVVRIPSDLTPVNGIIVCPALQQGEYFGIYAGIPSGSLFSSNYNGVGAPTTEVDGVVRPNRGQLHDGLLGAFATLRIQDLRLNDWFWRELGFFSQFGEEWEPNMDVAAYAIFDRNTMNIDTNRADVLAEMNALRDALNAA